MSERRTFLGSTLALALGGCSLSRENPSPTMLYVIDPPAPAHGGTATRTADTLRLGSVRVASAFSASELVYRLDDVRHVADPYHRLASSPAGMLGTRSAEWLNRWGPYRAVAQPGSAMPTPLVLDVVFTALYGDFRPGQAPAAVLAAQFQLLEVGATATHLRLERSYEQRVDLPRASPYDLVRGFGRALALMLEALSADLARAPT